MTTATPKLDKIAVGNDDVTVKALNLDANDALTREIQARLIELGCLDPGPDGVMGPVSKLALKMFAARQHLAYDDALTPKIAHALVTEKADSFIPLTLGTDLAGRIVKYMLAQKQFVARFPGFRTIVYLEGADKDGTPNKNTLDHWNDRRIVLRIGTDGKPVIDLDILATTEPGRHYTLEPMKAHLKDGTAHIALGQQKAWVVGTHHGGSGKHPHEALIQGGPLAIVRDKNRDGKRNAKEHEVVGTGFGINQHAAFGDPATIGLWSAGCLVAQSFENHKKFMTAVKKDPRYKETHGYRFMTTVIPATSLPT